MTYFFFTSALGWMATILIAAQIVLPYLLRPSGLSRVLGLARQRGSAYLRRLLPHYWIGYLLLVLSAAHAWIPMLPSPFFSSCSKPSSAANSSSNRSHPVNASAACIIG